MKRFGTIMLGAAGLVALLVLGSCGDDAPGPDHEVRVETARFFPNQLDIRPGESVRWVNILPKSPDNIRTVTDGMPDSTMAGSEFDVSLQGHESGEAVGESYTRTFGGRGDFPYFTRFPSSNQFTGIVRVR